LWLFGMAMAAWLLFVQWAPQASRGSLGRVAAGAIYATLGQAGYLFAPLFLYGLVFLLRGAKRGLLAFCTGTLIALCAVACELSLLRGVFTQSLISGGRAGDAVAMVLSRIFGSVGAAIFGAAIFFTGVHILFGIAWVATLQKITGLIKEDFAAWRASRLELKTKITEAKKKERDVEIRRAPVSTPAEERPLPEAETHAHQAAEPERETPLPPQVLVTRSSAMSQPKADKKAPGKRAPRKEGEWELPTKDFLTSPPQGRSLGPTDEEITAATNKLAETLASFHVEADVTGVSPGPVVTRYEIKPRPGVKVSSIVNLSNDIALSMKARGIRVEAPIPGKDAIGFEIPNEKPAMVYIKEILDDHGFARKNPLLVGLGRYADGMPAFANVEKMPHLLVAGATNSGKSICLQTIIVSLLYRNTPDKVKFLMIDPKRLELTFYENIPHLYDPKADCHDASVVTDPKGAVKSLQSLVKVMETRYKIFEAAKVKNIEGYNRWAKENGKEPTFYIIVIIDELADLMLQTKSAVEDSIQRLAQMARAVGIHLVLCTQRPSVDIITGVIKANLPSRIALQVASKTDSRVIIDSPGADTLLGKGDMLFLAIDAQKPSRVQGAYVSEEEITRVADFLRAQGGPDYPPQLPDETGDGQLSGLGVSPEDFKGALQLVMERRRVSQDLLKAHFGSSARATNMLSILELKGYIEKPDGSNRWDIHFDKIEHQLSVMESQTLFEAAAPAGTGEPQPQNEEEH